MLSVIIPLYNKERSIRNTLQSVCEQTYADIEILVVDDGSTDNSVAVVNSNQDARIRLIRKDNGGVCSARNRGVQEAKGEYIALLDADDLWDREYLAEQMKMIADFPDAAMWGINYAEISRGKIIRRLETGLPEGYRGYVDHYFEMQTRVSDLFCSSSVLIHREVFEQVGLFDERIKFAEDTDMWWRIIATNRVAFNDKCMVSYQWDTENRALNRKYKLTDSLSYYVSKYRTPIYRSNPVFYRYVNRWATCHIRNYYFSDDEMDRNDARAAVKMLDYSVIPFKYRMLYGLPYPIAKVFDKLDKLYHAQ